jgi:hypothetical protein
MSAGLVSAMLLLNALGRSNGNVRASALRVDVSIASRVGDLDMTQKELRIRIVGASANGNWAEVSHVPAINGLRGLKLAAVATRNEQSAREAAEAFGVDRWFSDPFATIGLMSSPSPSRYVMKKKNESKRHIEDVTQEEVSAAIRYLDPDLRSTNTPDYDTGVAICIALALMELACLAFTWVYL